MRKHLPHILIILFVFIAIPITSVSGGAITLRSHYRSLSVTEVQSMLNVSIREKWDWGFYGHSRINHDYNLKTIGGDNVVVDNTTGLMWHQSGSYYWMIWEKAKEWIKKLNKSGYAGYYDWRLPTVEEAPHCWQSSKKNDLYINSIFSCKQQWIWTGDRNGSEAVWYVGFLLGCVHGLTISNTVRPVRSAE